jgi:hypothetical protein
MKIAISELEHLRQEVMKNYQIIEEMQKKRPWVGLDEEEISNIWDDTVAATVIPFSTGFARAVEAKLKERNHD